MSDPALKSISSRLAEQDDDLVCYRFRCTTIAFARFADIQAAEDPAPQSPDSFWSELKEVFFQPSPPPVPVVRVPPDDETYSDYSTASSEKLPGGRGN
ncbi:MAG TPA: hypothetical protein VMS37_09455 [Verrucomicrobiae bacterium]|nr:hypothetical protein [Verrucomicrobiae bacterium]